MEVVKGKPGIMTLRHQYGNTYKSDDNYLYTRLPNGVFEIAKTAPPKKWWQIWKK